MNFGRCMDRKEGLELYQAPDGEYLVVHESEEHWDILKFVENSLDEWTELDGFQIDVVNDWKEEYLK